MMANKDDEGLLVFFKPAEQSRCPQPRVPAHIAEQKASTGQPRRPERTSTIVFYAPIVGPRVQLQKLQAAAVIRARGRRSRSKSALPSNKLRKTEQTGCVVTQQSLKRALDVALDVRCAPAVVQLRARIDIHNCRYAAGKWLHVPVDS